jgi:outer membrane protein
MRWTLLLLLACSLSAQDPLTLRGAVELALRSNPLVEAAEAGERETEAGIRQARSGYMPRLSFSESLQRSNNPVFVFGSLLTQRQFTAANFDLGPLNRPEALNNLQSRLSVEQVLFDARRTSNQVRAARFSREMAGEEKRRSDSEVILAVVKGYLGAVMAAGKLDAAEQSLRSAQADLRQAEAVFAAGRSTPAEVLAVKVHVAAVQEQRIQAASDLAVARAALNDALGVPLDRAFELTTPLAIAPAGEAALSDYVAQAAKQRPEIRQADLAQRLAETQQDIARAGYWPEVVFQGLLEADRQRYFSRGGANWFTALTMRWNLWDGAETKARVEQARFAEARAAALERRAQSGVELEIRTAYLDLNAANQRLEVAAAAVAEAEEAYRIIRNRYQAGLTTVTELLRSETALSASRIRRLAATYDQRVAAAALERAAGSLTVDSAVVN